MVRVGCIVVVFSACGRLHFDPERDGATDATADAAAGCAETISGLVVCFGFETPPGTAIPDSISGDPGSCAGAACPTAVPGRHGQGYHFDGVDDCIQVPDVGQFPGQSFTIAIWARQDTAGGVSQVSKLVGPMQPGNMSNTWQLESGSGGAIDQAVSFTTDPHGYLWSPADAIVLGQWQHLAGTASYDAANMTTTLAVYVDGSLVSSTSTGPIVDDSGAVSIGCDDNNPDSEFFPGTLDDLQVYDRALTPAEIAQLAAS